MRLSAAPASLLSVIYADHIANTAHTAAVKYA